MKKEKKDQIIRRISEQSMLKLTPMGVAMGKTNGWANMNGKIWTQGVELVGS
jgi:hypothetical protein